MNHAEYKERLEKMRLQDAEAWAERTELVEVTQLQDRMPVYMTTWKQKYLCLQCFGLRELCGCNQQKEASHVRSESSS